jgi:hypothetical protein
MLFPKYNDHDGEGKLGTVIEKHDDGVVVNSVQLGQNLWDELIKINVLFLMLMIMGQVPSENFVYLLVNGLDGLYKLAQGSLKLESREKIELCLSIAFLSKMGESLSRAEDTLFLPLDGHLGDEALIVLIELQRDIHCAD